MTHRTLPLRVLAPGLAALLTAGVAMAEFVNLTPAQDTTLFGNDVNLSNGAGPHLFVGRTATFGVRRGLLTFDVAGVLPAGSTIHGVTLTLNCSRVPDSFARDISLHRLTESWGEAGSDSGIPGGQGAQAEVGDATWNKRFWPDTDWTTGGGAFDLVASATTAVGETGSYGWGSTATMVADVQGWIDDPESNHGWILVGVESNPRTARRFDSRENLEETTRPVLTIEFTPPAVQSEDAVMAFGASGTYLFANNVDWLWLTALEPEQVLTADVDGNGIDDIVFDFGANGVWLLQNGNSWRFLTSFDPSSMAAGRVDNDFRWDLAFMFPDAGGAPALYLYMDGTTWEDIADIDGDRIAMADLDSNTLTEVVFDAAGAGLWVYRDGAAWEFLAALDVEDLAVASLSGLQSRDELIVDAGASCTYVLRDGVTWSLLTCANPDAIAVGNLDGTGADELILDVGSATWLYQNDSTWSLLAGPVAGMSTGDVEDNGADDLILGLEAGGTYAYMNGTSWRFLSALTQTTGAAGEID